MWVDSEAIDAPTTTKRNVPTVNAPPKRLATTDAAEFTPVNPFAKDDSVEVYWKADKVCFPGVVTDTGTQKVNIRGRSLQSATARLRVSQSQESVRDVNMDCDRERGTALTQYVTMGP